MIENFIPAIQQTTGNAEFEPSSLQSEPFISWAISAVDQAFSKIQGKVEHLRQSE